jgi:hypothetical protein
MDVMPRVPMCFDSGLTIVSSSLVTTGLGANLANSSTTDFPVSKTEDRRLLAKTSGATFVNGAGLMSVMSWAVADVMNDLVGWMMRAAPQSRCWMLDALLVLLITWN